MRCNVNFAAILALGTLPALTGCPTGSTGAPQAETVETDVKLDLPSPPEFRTPEPYPDGTHSVLEMRRQGGKFMDQDVKVKGFVVWEYDCIAEIGEAAYKETPEKCQKPHFLLGDAADTPRERAIEVVDVPRPPRADEKKYLPKEDLKNWPEVPEVEAGDEVVIEGKWAQRSPLGFVNTDGLLVFGRLNPEGPAPTDGDLPTKAPPRR